MIFFLYGPDIYRKTKKLQQITEEFMRKRDPSRLNVATLGAGNTDEEGLRQALRASPFLATKRMVVLKNFLTGAGRKDLHETLEKVLPSLGDERIAVISEDEAKPKKQKDWKNQTVKKVWEYLEKNAQCEEFSELSGLRLEKEIGAMAKAHGLALQKDAAALLAVLSGGDLGWAEKEMEKLEAYCAAPSSQPSPPKGGEGGYKESPLPAGEGKGERRTITPSHITLICTPQDEANIFEFLDALGNRDQKILLRTAEEHLRGIDALRLINQAVRHLRALLAVTLAGQAGAQALKLHSFVAKKAAVQSRKWKADELKKALFELMTLEYNAKRGLVADLNTQLTVLLTKFSSP